MLLKRIRFFQKYKNTIEQLKAENIKLAQQLQLAHVCNDVPSLKKENAALKENMRDFFNKEWDKLEARKAACLHVVSCPDTKLSKENLFRAYCNALNAIMV